MLIEDAETLRPPAMFSLLDFLPLRENSAPRTLSGLSERVDGIPLEVDLCEDFRDRLAPSVDGELESRDRKEGVVDDSVLLLELLPKIELLFIASVYARILSGEGGPSMAGCRDSAEEEEGPLNGEGGPSFLLDTFLTVVMV